MTEEVDHVAHIWSTSNVWQLHCGGQDTGPFRTHPQAKGPSVVNLLWTLKTFCTVIHAVAQKLVAMKWRHPGTPDSGC